MEMDVLFLCAHYGHAHPAHLPGLTLPQLAEWGALYQREMEIEAKKWQ